LSSGRFVRADGESEAAPPARWWQGLGDPELDRLVEAGLAGAPRIHAAEARLRQARQRLAQSRAGRLPVAGASALLVHAELPDDVFGASGGQESNLYAAGFDANWELDLWGGKRRAAERSRAQAEAAAEALADAHVQLSAEIGRNYVELREREARLGMLDLRLKLETQAAGLIAARVERGTLSRQSAEQAGQRQSATRAEMAAVRAEADALRDGLAVLTGQAPGTLDALPAAAIPLPPADVAIGDPARLLARRPDLRAAERQLVAANAGIGIAEARRLPQISLFGLVGTAGTEAGDIVDGGALAAFAVPRLNWSFLDFGRSLAALRAARAGRDEALANYREALLGVLRDAETALSRFSAARTSFALAGETAKSAERIEMLDAMRAQAGTISRGDAIESRVRALEADAARSAARAALTLRFIALTKALGLGWQDLPPQ